MRNLIIRSASGIVFLSVMLACILGGAIPYACLMLFILIGMMYEFYKLTLGKKNYLQKTIGTATGIICWLAFFPPLACNNSFTSLLVIAFVLWIALLIQQLYQKNEQTFAAIAYTLLGFMYIALPLSLMNMIAYNFENEYDGKLLLGLFIILWCSDVGAYVFGMAFGQKGKHKLFPGISPKKSWEGFAGGLLLALCTGYLMSCFGFIAYGAVHALIISGLIAVFGVFGDLVESMLKRSAGVKDSGKIMPGHGGLLDRFDAALIALPAVWCYIFMINELNL